MSAPINYMMNDSEEEELGALIYKSSQTAKKFLGLSSSAPAGGASNTKKRAGPSADDCPARNEGCNVIHESSFRYSLQSSSKKLKMGEATDETFCTGDNMNMLQEKQSQVAKPSPSITSHIASIRYNSRRASHRLASNEATEPEPEHCSSTASATLPSLSSMYCTVINDGRKSAEKEGTYTDRKGREFVIKQSAGKKYKHFCKPELVNGKIPQARLLCKHPGCTTGTIKGGVCVKHGAKKKLCKIEGCTSISHANHLCCQHGEKKICKHNGCTNIAKGNGVCQRHLVGYKPRKCKHEGCHKLARRGGICRAHGSKPKMQLQV